MTRDQPPTCVLDQAWRLDPATCKNIRTSRRKAASSRNIDRAWRLSFQQKITRIEGAFLEGRCGRQQRLRIRMPRIEKQVVIVGDFDHFTEVHHRYTGTDLPHHGKVM